MFFEKEAVAFSILDVMELDQRNVNTFNSGRNFSALSYRFHSDACLKTSDGEFNLSDKCVVYVPPRCDYTRTAATDELIVIHFNVFDYTSQTIEFFESKSASELTKLFKSILQCWKNKETGYKLTCSAILCEILSECYKQNLNTEKQASKIQKSIDFILKEYRRNDLTIEEISSKSFISEVYFRKLFKNEYGTSPQKYIVNLRIQNAINLISSGYYSLKEVAYLSGYTDYKYFSTEFKRITGVSPSKYLYKFRP